MITEAVERAMLRMTLSKLRIQNTVLQHANIIPTLYMFKTYRDRVE